MTKQAKDEFIMDDETTEVTAPAVTTEETGLALNDFSEGVPNLEGLENRMLGTPPFIKAPRGPKAKDKAGKIIFDKDTVICGVGEKTAMLIVGTGKLYATAYSMEEKIVDGQKQWYLPRFENTEDGIAKGYTRVYPNWGEDASGKRVGPNNIPAMDLIVLVEVPEELGGTQFDGRHWVKGIISACAGEWEVAQKFLRKWGSNEQNEDRRTWMLEWELSAVAKGDNHYLSTELKKIHLNDSDFAAEYNAVFG